MKQAWLALAAMSLGFFLTLLDQSMIAVALPEIAQHFDVTYAEAAWASSGYLLAVVAPLLVTGRLGDKYGPRRMFLMGLTIFGVGALLSALAPNLLLLVVFRLIQGFGAACLMPQSLAVINRVFPPQHRGKAFGVWGVVGALAGIAGPLIGGAVVGWFGWWAVFAVHVPIVIVASVLVYAWVPKLETVSVDVDKQSVVLALIAVASLVAGIQQGSWIALIAIPAGIWFFKRQQKDQAMFPLTLLRVRSFTTGTMTITVMGALASSQLLPIMAWAQTDQNLDPQAAGALAIPMAIAAALLGPVGGWASDQLPPRILHLTGFSILGITLAVLAYFMFSGAGVIAIAATITFLGIGQSFIWASNAATSLRDVPVADMGAASGAYNTSRQLGAVLGVAVISILITLLSPAAAMVGLSVIALMGVVASSALPKRAIE